MTTCSVPECTSPSKARTFCSTHYFKWWRYGNAEDVRPDRTIGTTLETFPWHLFIENADGCWIWTGPISSSGYGRASRRYVHRVTYELLVAPIPKGLQIDHLCRTPACGNPWHLEPVTARVNTLRSEGASAKAARLSVCKQGHPFDAENTYVTPNGRRQCRACGRLRWASAASRSRETKP